MALIFSHQPMREVSLAQLLEKAEALIPNRILAYQSDHRIQASLGEMTSLEQQFFQEEELIHATTKISPKP